MTLRLLSGLLAAVALVGACYNPHASHNDETTHVAQIAQQASLRTVSVVRNGTALCPDGTMGNSYAVNAFDDSHYFSFGKRRSGSACVNASGHVYLKIK